jgi:hypothetical protein
MSTVTVNNDKSKRVTTPMVTPLSAFVREQAERLATAGEFGAFAAGALLQLAEDVEALRAKTPAEFQARAEVMPDVLRDALWTLEAMQGDIDRALRQDDVYVLASTTRGADTAARLKSAIARGMPIYAPSPCDDRTCEVHFPQGGPDDEVPF